MKLSQLEALIAIADGHGIAGAAEKLNISQPAITKSLSNLECELDVELLDRSEYRLKLSSYGERLLSHARAMTSEKERAVLEIELMKEKGQELICVNGSPGVMPKLIPLALQRARQNIPRLIIEFGGQMIGSPEKKYTDLAEGLYDLLIYPVEQKHDIDDFVYEPLLDINLIIMASKNHPASKLIRPSLKELCHYDWLLPSREGLPNRMIRRAFREAGVNYPDTVLTLPMREMLFSFLRNGEYLAFVPYHPAIGNNETDEFRIIDADIPVLKWTLHAIQRKLSAPSAGMLEFLSALKGVVEDEEQAGF